MPKRLFNTSLKTTMILFFVSVFFISLILISLSVIKGLEISSRMDMAKNFTSHLNIKTRLFDAQNLYNRKTWWQSPRTILEERIADKFVRGITRRTYLPGFFTDANTQLNYPVCVIAIENSDASVFNPKLYLSLNNTTIPVNSIHIGKKLAEKFNFSRQQTINLSIPPIETTLSSIKIVHILPEINPFIDHFGVFLNRASLTNIGSEFTDYHIRFRGTPYQPLLISNFSIFIDDEVHFTPDEKLNYQFLILNKLRNLVLQWGSLIYIMLGILFFFVHYIHRSYFSEDIKIFAYRHGYLKVPHFYIRLISKTLLLIFLSSLSAIGVSLTFTALKLRIFANPFIGLDGLFPEYGMGLDYIFSPQTDIINWGKIIGIGLGSALFVYIVLLLLFYGIKRFSSFQNKETILIASIIIMICFGYLSTEKYFFNISAEKGREKFWKQVFFGETTLFHKNYLANNFLKTPQNHFEFPSGLEDNLIKKKIPYVAFMEANGVVVNKAENDQQELENMVEKQIYIKSIIGTNSLIYNDLIAKTSSRKVILGKGIADDLKNPPFITVTMKDIDGIDVEIDFGIDEVIQFETRDLNNSLFINHEVLNNLINIPINSITKLQVLDKYSSIHKYTNDTLIAQDAKKSFKNWVILSDIVLFCDFIKTNTQLLIGIFILIMMLSLMTVYDKKTCQYLYTWGYSYYPFRKQYWILLQALGLGMILSKCKNIFSMIYKTPLPEFLKLEHITTNSVHFGFGVLYLILILFSVFLMGCIGHIMLQMITNKIIKKIVFHNYKNNLS
ncbi:MAG: hypothetical protein ACRCVW_06455 [Brevinema sp.]